MDEPVTYLDLEGKRTFFSMVNKLKKSGKTIILVLHDLSDAIRISDNLVIMNDRKIAISDTPANCLKTHIIEDVFHTTYKKFSDDELWYTGIGSNTIRSLPDSMNSWQVQKWYIDKNGSIYKDNYINV